MTEIVLLTGSEADETPASIAGRNGYDAVDADNTNISLLIAMLKEQVVESAYVRSWNGQSGDFVLRSTGALGPYDAFTNNAYYAFGVEKSAG
ncbi:hypothetical protein [Streptomyces sp. NPDC002467]|uniref:hypothetical protein n=1 Tax=Streptomyces sp. NPDC002467 TaxID=3364647 RepID=UPI0036A6A975